jgi:hypothetical protein
VPHGGILAAVDAVEVKQLRPGEIGGSHVDQRRRCVNTEYGVRAFESIVQPFLIQGLRTLATTRDRTRRLRCVPPCGHCSSTGRLWAASEKGKSC